MNIIEIVVTINPNSYFGKDEKLKIYKQEIIKETEKQIKVNNFGHKWSSFISKIMLDKIQEEEMLEKSVSSIKRWIYVKEDEDYNEENVKAMLIESVIQEINRRKDILDKMKELIKTI